MLNKVRKVSKTDKFAYFIRYLAVFTMIFGLMTMLIFQTMRSTIYGSTDQMIERALTDPTIAIRFAVARSYIPDAEIVFEEEVSNEEGEATKKKYVISTSRTRSSSSDKLHLGANYYVLLFDKDKNLINPDFYTGLSEQTLDKDSLKGIRESVVKSPFGSQEAYRYMTLELKEEDYAIYAGRTVRYASIMVNVSQIKQSLTSFESTVLLVIISFWLISIVASLYLSQLSMRPILASYQKQKDFVENASHELRTPLSVLQNRLESLFRNPDLTIMDSSESIASSLTEVRNMRLLTTNLLNLARRDEELKACLELVEPSYFHTIFENYQLIASSHDKSLVIDNQITRPVMTDKVLIKQLLTILFDNAIKYTGEGAEIGIQAQVKEKYLYLAIADNGIGISDQDKTKVFERFYRVDKARTRQNGGFGLGLSLAKQIIDSLKGDIRIVDNQPQGTIFECRLPR